MNSQEEIVKEQISLIPSAHSRQVTGSVNQINSMYVSKHLLCTQKSTWAKVTERDESKPGDCYTLPGIGTGLRWSSYLFLALLQSVCTATMSLPSPTGKSLRGCLTPSKCHPNANSELPHFTLLGRPPPTPPHGYPFHSPSSSVIVLGCLTFCLPSWTGSSLFHSFKTSSTCSAWAMIVSK